MRGPLPEIPDGAEHVLSDSSKPLNNTKSPLGSSYNGLVSPMGRTKAGS